MQEGSIVEELSSTLLRLTLVLFSSTSETIPACYFC
ncbi:hypothetical protein SAMN05216604_10528 [Pseudomonas agarici]|nr:hypothetical protein SAMN05216604_10528 [Pseudomonas agarici]